VEFKGSDGSWKRVLILDGRIVTADLVRWWHFFGLENRGNPSGCCGVTGVRQRQGTVTLRAPNRQTRIVLEKEFRALPERKPDKRGEMIRRSPKFIGRMNDGS
jgi:hypothetical protein